MATVTIEVPDDAFSALRRSPKEFARDMRVAAAIQWYHQMITSFFFSGSEPGKKPSTLRSLLNSFRAA